MLVRQMTNEELCKFANQIKDLIAEKLHIQELDNYAVVIVEKGMFGKAWEKIFGDSDNAAIRLMVDVKDKG